jgi:hypothetical protein
LDDRLALSESNYEGLQRLACYTPKHEARIKLMSTAPAPHPKQQLHIAYFIELQRRIFDILRYVSCHKDNFDTYAIIIESLLTDSSSFFDSLCQTLIRARSSSGHHFTQELLVPDFTGKVNETTNFNFGDYRLLLEGELTLSNRELNLNPYDDVFYAYPTSYAPWNVSGYLVTPFHEWATGASSPWWKAFTDLKHDRISNFRQATLGNTIHALAAVFILLTEHNERDFKEGHVPIEVYNLFLPKYWKWKGRIFTGNFTWE